LRRNRGALIYKNHGSGHFLEIRDNGDHRSLYFNSDHLQGQMSLATPEKLVISYTWYMLMALLLSRQPKRILVLGIGAGSFIRFFLHHFPECMIDAVDNSQNVISAAKKFFQISQQTNLSIYHSDGFLFLQETQGIKYDIILVDAFDKKGMAPTIYDAPCLALMQKQLTRGGVISCNLWSSEKTQLRQIKTILADQFLGNVYLPVPDRANVISLSMSCEIPWSQICCKKMELRTLTRRYGFNFGKIVRVAKQNNFTLSQKISSALGTFPPKGIARE
jgi:spermidine synthase